MNKDIEIIKTRIIDKIRKDIIDEKDEINYKLIKIIDYIEDIKTLKLIEEIMEGGKAWYNIQGTTLRIQTMQLQ